jgi:phosphopantetheine adenylyltransferase
VKFEKEVKMLDSAINETKDVMIALKLKYDNLVEEFNGREDEVQEYLEEKKIKDDAIFDAEQRYQAVVKIQS